MTRPLDPPDPGPSADSTPSPAPEAGDGIAQDAEVLDFREELERDRRAGKHLPLSHYLRRYRRAEAAVAREYLSLTQGGLPSPAQSRASRAASGGPPRLGHYRLLRELGRGGQGAVWLAEDERLARRVALKVLAGGLSWISGDRRRRFRREAEVVARLEHAAICPVLEADLDAETPYIAMRHVEGRTLAQVIAEARQGRRDPTLPLPPRQRLELARALAFFERTARALHAAHEAGVLHRDVKPGNLMVTPAGEPVVLDFGQARDLLADGDANAREAHEHTRTGDVFGTPAYMSPEQLAGDPGAIGRGADVWALGVTLYEALTLERAFAGPTTAALARAIAEREPADPRGANRALPDDVRAVLETALEKDPARRYPSALELAEDLRRVREYEPIRARPAGPLVRLSRWARRRPALAAALAVAFLSLTLGLALFARGLARESRALDRRAEAIANESAALSREQAALVREREALAAERVALDHALARHLAERTLALLGEDPGAALALGIEAVELEANAFTRAALLAALEGCRVESAYFGDPARRALDLDLVPDGERALVALDDGRVVLVDLASGAATLECPRHGGAARAVVWLGGLDPAPDLALSGGADGIVRASCPESGVERARLGPLPGGVLALELSGDREHLAIVDGEGGVSLVAARTLEPRWQRPAPHPVAQASFALGGERIVLASRVLQGGPSPRSSEATLLAAADGRELARLAGHAGWIRDVAVSADGLRLATASEDGSVRLWAARDGAPIGDALELGRPVWSVAFSPDGRLLAAGCAGGPRASLVLFDLERGTRRDLDGHPGAQVAHVTFDARGERLASSAFDTSVALWEVSTGRELARLRALFQPMRAHFSADGRRVVTLSNDRIVHTWIAGPLPDAQTLVGHAGEVLDAHFLPGSGAEGPRAALTASADGTARLWGLAGAGAGRELAQLAGHGAAVHRALPRPGHDQALTLCGDGRARLFALGPPAHLLGEFDLGAPLVEGRIDPGGARAAVLDAAGVASLIDLDTGRVRELASGGTECLAWDGRGERLAAGDRWGRVRLFDARGEAAGSLDELELPGARPGEAGVRTLAFRPGSGELALALGVADAGVVLLVDPASGAQTRAPLRLFEPSHLAFDGTGERLLVRGPRGARALRLYDLAAGRELRQVLFHQAILTAGAFGPGGELVVTAARDGWVHAARGLDGTPFLRVARHAGGVTALDLAPGPRGLLALTGGAEGVVRVWPVDPLPSAQARRPRRLLRHEIQRETDLARPLVYPPAAREGER